MSIEVLTSLIVIALVFIIVAAAGFGLEIIRKEKLVHDGAILLAITSLTICGMFFLFH